MQSYLEDLLLDYLSTQPGKDAVIAVKDLEKVHTSRFGVDVVCVYNGKMCSLPFSSRYRIGDMAQTISKMRYDHTPREADRRVSKNRQTAAFIRIKARGKGRISAYPGSFIPLHNLDRYLILKGVITENEIFNHEMKIVEGC